MIGPPSQAASTCGTSAVAIVAVPVSHLAPEPFHGTAEVSESQAVLKLDGDPRPLKRCLHLGRRPLGDPISKDGGHRREVRRHIVAAAHPSISSTNFSSDARRNLEALGVRRLVGESILATSPFVVLAFFDGWSSSWSTGSACCCSG